MKLASLLSSGWDSYWRSRKHGAEDPVAERSFGERAAYIWGHISRRVGARFNLLELGCGEALVVRHLLTSAPQGTATLVDWSDEALDRARHTLRKFSHRTVFIKGDANSPLAFQAINPNVVLSLGVIEHHPRPDRVLLELSQILSPNAVLVIMTPNRRSFARLSRYVLQSLGRWNLGHQDELSPAILTEFCQSAGLNVFHSEARVRPYFRQDPFVRKTCAALDRIAVTCGATNWGWYTWVFCQKM